MLRNQPHLEAPLPHGCCTPHAPPNPTTSPTLMLHAASRTFTVVSKLQGLIYQCACPGMLTCFISLSFPFAPFFHLITHTAPSPKHTIHMRLTHSRLPVPPPHRRPPGPLSNTYLHMRLTHSRLPPPQNTHLEVACCLKHSWSCPVDAPQVAHCQGLLTEGVEDGVGSIPQGNVRLG